MMHIFRALLVFLAIAGIPRLAIAQVVIVTAGPESAVECLKSIDWWGEDVRDGPLRFVFGAGNEEDAVRLREKIGQMRTSGEVDQIIRRYAPREETWPSY